MAGVKGRSGRKRNIRNIQKYFNREFDLRSPELVRKLIEKALGGDITTLIYVFDRRLGKPKSEVTVDGGEGIGAGMVKQIYTLMAERRKELLRETRKEALPPASPDTLTEPDMT